MVNKASVNSKKPKIKKASIPAGFTPVKKPSLIDQKFMELLNYIEIKEFNLINRIRSLEETLLNHIDNNLIHR